MPTGDLRRALRAHGHAMSPIVQVGKAGVTQGVIKQVNQALADHELIKVKVGGECPVDRHEVGFGRIFLYGKLERDLRGLGQ